MKIGGLFGFTAPMLMFAMKMTDSDLVQAAALLDNPVDRSLLTSFKYETQCFQHALKNVPYVFFSPTYDSCFEKIEPYRDYTYENGRFTPEISDESVADELEENLKQTLLQKLAYSILALPDSERIRAWSVNDLVSCVNQWCDSRPVALSAIARNVRGMLKSMLVPASNSVGLLKPELTETLEIQAEIDNERMGISKEEVKVLEFLISNSYLLDGIGTAMRTSSLDDVNTFGFAFHDLMNSNPRRLLYIISERFESVKEKSQAKQFENNLEFCRENLKIFKEQFATRVVPLSLAKENSLHKSEIKKLQQLISDERSEKKKSLFKRKLDLNSITSEEYKLLSTLYDCAAALRIETLNKLCGVSLTEDDWLQLSLKLSRFDIGGLNLQTLALFKESLSIVTYCSTSRIQRSEDFIEQVTNTIDDVQALLDTMIPIGAKIDVDETSDDEPLMTDDIESEPVIGEVLV